ncbi:hypothetical protein MKW94_029583 [Papaver nudicaule]|uniref:Uncharacterized protein n=1 Tax=Papaver nudicaule TaxID=74823 RepID=A0AA42B3D7_PAPNU|nr:hypothetical protein [Papaver nudicaule]
MESDDCMLKYFVEDDEYDDSIEYGDGYCDYAEGYFYDEENGWGGMEMSPVSNEDAIIVGTDDKKQSDMPEESSMDTQSISHPLSDEERTNMDIKDGASVDNMATERRKKEKRKSQDDGVESEQNDRNEIAIEVKKKKDSISKSDV